MAQSIGWTYVLLGLLGMAFGPNVLPVEPFAQESAPNKPMFFAMEDEWEQGVHAQEVLTFFNKDTLLEHQLSLLSNEQGEPLLFYADIVTPVCIDNICKPVHLELYWNLVGEYVGYDTHQRFPLTKYDHDEFVPEDYEKLHQLLMDRHSILERKEMSDLFDANAKPEKQITYQGEEVDAVTGATKKEIKNTVVEGALYSCYTLWHLVHGDVRTKMAAYLEEHYSPQLGHAFLHSDYPDYQLYALKQMEDSAYVASFPRVLTIYRQAKPLIRTYILKRLPQTLWQSREIADSLYQTFPEVDITSQTLLLQKLEQADPISLEKLSPHLPLMSRNQLKIYLAALAEGAIPLQGTLLEALRRTEASDTYAYGYLITEFLETYLEE